MMTKDPWAYVQWKGTDVCIDFHCLCDKEDEPAGVGHFDGYGAYFLKCMRCHRVYKVPTELKLELASEDDHYVEVWPDENTN